MLNKNIYASESMEQLKAVMKKHPNFKKQGGFLAELMIAIGVFAVIALAAVLIAPAGIAKWNASKLADEFAMTIPHIQSGMRTQNNFSTLTEGMVAKNHWISNEYIEFNSSNVPTGNLITAWGTITIRPASSNQEGQVTVTNVPPVSCSKFAEYLGSDMYTKATIGGASVKDITISRNVDMNVVGTQCSAGPSTTITFNFARA